MNPEEEFELSTIPILCDGCEDPSATYRAKTGTFWCETCRKQLAMLNVEV